MTHVPTAGDIFWVELDPVPGTEQAGRRPALVLTAAAYHKKSTRAVICPISSKARNWPFEVPLPEGLKTRGVVLIDQLRAIHRPSRLFSFVESVPPRELAAIRGRLASLVGIDRVFRDLPQ